MLGATTVQMAFALEHWELLRREQLQDLERALGTYWNIADLANVTKEDQAASGSGQVRRTEMRIPLLVGMNPRAMEAVYKYFGKNQGPHEPLPWQRPGENKRNQDRFWGSKNELTFDIENPPEGMAESLFDLPKDALKEMVASVLPARAYAPPVAPKK